MPSGLVATVPPAPDEVPAEFELPVVPSDVVATYWAAPGAWGEVAPPDVASDVVAPVCPSPDCPAPVEVPAPAGSPGAVASDVVATVCPVSDGVVVE